MLDEFILEQLDRVESEYLELNDSLQNLEDQEKEIQRQMEDYLSKEDIGVEFFSPRSSTGPVKEKISELQKHLEEIHLLQLDVTDKIARNREKDEKYHLFLNESRMKGLEENKLSLEPLKIDATSVSSSDGEENGSEHHAVIQIDEAKEILERIDRCINLIGHDRNKCKSELKNLRYYLKALIAEASER